MSDSEQLKSKYAPIVQQIIDNNSIYYRFEAPVRWEFFEDQHVANTAYTNNAGIKINILYVDFAYTVKKEPLQVEYFILHEIRHLFQKISVLSCTQQNAPMNPLTERWKVEFENYLPPQINTAEYYEQMIEFDAFAFSYSLMLFKYGPVPYIQPPQFYIENYPDVFKFAIDKYLQNFKEFVG